MGEVRTPRPVRSEAGDTAVRLPLVVDRLHWGDVALIAEPPVLARAVHRAGEGRAEMGVPEPAEDVVVIVGQVGERHRHADAGVERQVRRRYPVEVDATG